jgi:thiamine biosynthesis lipoprotein
MGTLFRIALYATNEPAARAGAEAAFQRVADLDDMMSDYQADSELMRLCDQPVETPVPVSEDLFKVFERAKEISARSGGAFDITVGPFVRLWRFSRKRHTLPESEQIAQACIAVGWRNLKLDPTRRTATLLEPDMRLDLGGIAKGYAADAALGILKGRGINRALVAASGDIAIGDPPPGQSGWRVGVSDLGLHTNDLNQTLVLRNAGISTSGAREQFVEIGGVRYSHIVDPKTGLGLTNQIQATVIAPNATTSDALATAVCVAGAKAGRTVAKAFPGVKVIILEGDQKR